MHFVDRTLYLNPPTARLAILQTEEKPKWLAYKACVKTKCKPAVPMPASKWNEDAIRIPLVKLFNFNCAYCGAYSDYNNDGEVDHFLPKALDDQADHIYSWDNYVWSCHSCNNLKRNNFPVLNPCIKQEMEVIYFNYLDGR